MLTVRPLTRSAGQVDRHADGGTAVVAAQLDQIAELVNEPKAASARGVQRGAATTDERLADAPGVTHVAHDTVAVRPDPGDAVTAAVAEAVRGDLIGCEHQIGSLVRP